MSEDVTTTYRAAVVQAASIPNDPRASADKAAQLIQDAYRGGARLAVFPEAFIGGYPKGASFGAPIGLRKPEGREAYRRLVITPIGFPSFGPTQANGSAKGGAFWIAPDKGFREYH